ncbi:MAG: RluA family pseudouridine synthase [Chlorobi bacterium]|nr:RluA family pseudouridine synthase [Chlorobiota bacterium]
MNTNTKHIVTEEFDNTIRATNYIPGKFPGLTTRSSVKKAIKKQQLFVNGEICKTGTIIKKGQIIEYAEKEIKIKKLFKLKLKIIYEDDFIALINKPPGISVSGNYFKTVQNALPFNIKKSTQKDALTFPLPVHRLDNQTSGLLIVAKTKQARINLGKQFEEKKILKKYNAIVIGKTPQKGIINFPVEEKYAITKFETLRTTKSLRNTYLSLLNLYPETGRTHQIRIHCEKSGFPILGDKLYSGDLPVFKGKGLFLSATEISFDHPVTGNFLTFKIKYPEKFDKITEREEKRFYNNNF